MYGIIYKATNLINNKVYIGQTKNSVEKRRRDHLINRKRQKYYFHNALIKYGIKNFMWEEIDKAKTKIELDEKEKYWIKFYNSINKQYGYNCTNGGSVPVFNEETRRKISESGIGRKHSEETKNKLSDLKKGKAIRPKGFKHSEETKQKMSKSHKGKKHKPLSNETKKKMSESRKGKIPHEWTEESRKKVSESGKGRIPWNKGITGYITKKNKNYNTLVASQKIKSKSA